MEINWRQEKRAVKDLRLWDKNPRTITKEGFEKLKERITKRGFHDVIKIDTDNMILSGNQRKRALVDLGVTEVNVLVPDRKLTDEERSAVALESNKNDGEWDLDSLASFDEVLLKEVGLEEAEFPQIIKDEVEEVENVEPVAPAITKSGEMFQLGDHRVICGDSTNQKTFSRLMGNSKADMIFTDPWEKYTGKKAQKIDA